MFTAITFSPVTEFIEKTRKLRDLYGSSFILSYLADSVCEAARVELRNNDAVISPARLNIRMGTPDQIVIQGDFPERQARAAFLQAWGQIMDSCREWVCAECQDWINTHYEQWIQANEWNDRSRRSLPWDRDWQLWKAHAWEFFWVQRASIAEVLEAIVEEEQDRDWVGINWLGESSTLSGSDAIAWPGLGLNIPPKRRSMAEADQQIRSFFGMLNQKIGGAILEDDLLSFRQDTATRLRNLARHYGVEDQSGNKDFDLRQELAKKLGEAIVTPREQLSIPELAKRLFTLRAVAQCIPSRDRTKDKDPLVEELPESFKDVNLWKTDLPMGWFRGDGDRAGQHIRDITQDPDQTVAAKHLSDFSRQMRQWGKWLKDSFDQKQGRIVFAGGDDFLGVFHPAEKPTAAIQWLCCFKENVWHRGDGGEEDIKPVTPSVGFVWASSQVPQRDILQHCELAEQSAKQNGRDRVCLRVLFSSGTHLEWACPWWLLPKIVRGYRDRVSKAKTGPISTTM
ncbi:MAG: CRISPR-associated protein [Leptolyngbyaceae cyanobacterium SM2_5_2]|nr:CRISPR-associated protein [Leptolyngbyaceae cyanobacterium SM2_5_2]